MAAPSPPTKPQDLEITVVSGKHLKNVNWRNGDLKPYAIFWVDPDCRLATKSDDTGSTKPVWNERFVIPLNLPISESVFTLEVFHSKPVDTPKPLVGTLRAPLRDLVDSGDSNRVMIFKLRRPSGRFQGKIRLKLEFRERPEPEYPIVPAPNYYYNTSPPPPPPPRDYRGYSPAHSPSLYSGSLSHPPPPPGPPSSSLPPPPHSYSFSSYSDPYTGYYSGYYSQPPLPPPPRPFFDRQGGYGGPSAPVAYAPYDQKPKGGKMGLGTGLAVGAVAGALGGLALEEGLKYEEEKFSDRAESDLAAKDDYRDY